MKAGDNIPNVDKYRKLVQTFINLHVYSSALFWADKVVALTGNPRDIYWLAQCMYLLKQYHRAIHLLRSQNLEKTHMLCNYLTVKCLLEARDYNEALKVVNSFNLQCIPYRSTTTMASTSTQENILFDDTPRNQTIAAVLLLKGKVLEAMDNRALAADCYKQALDQDVYCYEAFDCLIKYQMLTAAEEEELLHSLPIAEQCSQEEAQVLLTLYESKLKKYHTPTQPKSIEGNILFGSTPCSTRIFEKRSQQTFPSLPATPISTFPSSPVPKTPNTTRNEKDEMPEDKPPVESMVTEEQAADSSVVMTRLKDSLDLHVAEAERLFYNCDYRQCSQLTDAILKQDPYHTSCLPIHISCQVELKRSSKLFSLAHNLVDLYPNMAISWYAVGCYYYIIGKSDCARRYLAKATSLDRLFGPAWLAYGHSFAVENEHDQAMAAYFKATQLMKGCHLPLLYIGLECGLTNNVKLGEKFCSQAQAIAPDDPFIMHEKGVIAFIKQDYESAEINFKQALEKVKEIKKGIIPERWGSLYNNLGHTCRKLKKYEEALEYHKSALLLAPQSPSIYSAIGFVYSLIGNIDEAIDWFHKSLGLKRDDTFSTTMLNYVIERQSEEQPPFPGAPDEIPNFQLSSRRLAQSIAAESSNVEEIAGTSNNEVISDMSMSIEVDMADASNIVKE